jgi:REP element-mobilizing transposase RayT
MKREIPRRRDTRLPGWNYRLPGPYAITMCTQHRACLFGEVRDGQMVNNAIGIMVQDVWCDMAREFPMIALDAFFVMPNHVHAIVLLDDRDIERKPELGTIVQRFKSITTSRYINGVWEQGWPPFDGRLWQRNYYEHIVRDDRDLDRCRAYIEANRGNWHNDRDNVLHGSA